MRECALTEREGKRFMRREGGGSRDLVGGHGGAGVADDVDGDDAHLRVCVCVLCVCVCARARVVVCAHYTAHYKCAL
jgi:hypothetical protein